MIDLPKKESNKQSKVHLFVMRLTVFAIIAIQLAAVCLCAKRAWPNELDDNPPVEPRTEYKLPKDVPWLGDGDIFKLRKKHDILVVLVIQPFVCPKCEVGYRALMKAHSQIFSDETGHIDRLLHARDGKNLSSFIQFAMLDAEDEAPEFIALFSDVNEDNYRTKIPALLIFKQYHQDVLKKRPILFNFEEHNLNNNLLPHLVRLVGPDIAPIHSEQELMIRLSSKFTNRVGVVIWGDKPSKVMEQIALEGRFEAFWSIVPTESARLLLAPKFNADGYDVTFHFYKGKPDQDHLSDDLGTPVEDVLETTGLHIAKTLDAEGAIKSRRADRERKMIRDAYELALSQRPGYEFDHIKKTTLIEDHIPEGCPGKMRESKVGDRIMVQIVGKLVGVGTDFARSIDDVITVGMSRGDYPDLLLREGFEGMCVGSKRRIGFLATKAYEVDMLPPGVPPTAKIVFAIELVQFMDSDGINSATASSAPYPSDTVGLSGGATLNPPNEL